MVSTVCAATLVTISATSIAVMKLRYKDDFGWTRLTVVQWVLILGFAAGGLFIPCIPLQIVSGVCFLGVTYWYSVGYEPLTSQRLAGAAGTVSQPSRTKRVQRHVLEKTVATQAARPEAERLLKPDYEYDDCHGRISSPK